LTQQSASYLWIYHQSRNKFCSSFQFSPAFYLIIIRTKVCWFQSLNFLLPYFIFSTQILCSSAQTVQGRN